MVKQGLGIFVCTKHNGVEGDNTKNDAFSAAKRQKKDILHVW